MRIVSVGHSVYFEPHFCERQLLNDEVLHVDFDHFSDSFYNDVINFKPDVTLLYRPEMYSADLLKLIPGIKIGFSTEPLPKIVDGKEYHSCETDRRLNLVKTLDFSLFDAVYHYDKGSETFCRSIGLNYTGYRYLPVNTEHFHPRLTRPKWDALFVGKATEHRIRKLSALKSVNRPFLWVEHGVGAAEFAWLARHSKCVINVHADGLRALPPRVYIAAACGVPVLTEPITDEDFPFRPFVKEVVSEWYSFDIIDSAAREIASRVQGFDVAYIAKMRLEISVRTFIGEALGAILLKR